jgi:16S rRNA G966 N2-methylase RsmD
MAAALQQYTRQQRYTLEIQNDAAELKLRAERKAGELLRDMEKATGSPGNQYTGKLDRLHDETSPPTLADLRITKLESHRWQQAAQLSEEAFEAYITTTKARGQELTSKGVYDLARAAQHAAERRAKIAAEQGPLPADLVTLWQGDFTTVGDTILAASVDLILTDPPYGQDFVPAFDRLGALAGRVLKPGGSLLMLYGQRYLREAMAALERHLTYQWVLAYRLHGSALAVWSARVENHWKPLLWYVRGTYHGPMQGDIVQSADVPDKRFHAWGQAEEAFA